MKNQEPNKPTGNLEELFRHHLADATVPPPPHVWEQVDNALLLAQNHTYRRRLRVTRWVAAASLLLASLAGTGWWAQRDFQATTTSLARRPALGSPGTPMAADGSGATAAPRADTKSPVVASTLNQGLPGANAPGPVALPRPGTRATSAAQAGKPAVAATQPAGPVLAAAQLRPATHRPVTNPLTGVARAVAGFRPATGRGKQLSILASETASTLNEEASPALAYQQPTAASTEAGRPVLAGEASATARAAEPEQPGVAQPKLTPDLAGPPLTIAALSTAPTSSLLPDLLALSGLPVAMTPLPATVSLPATLPALPEPAAEEAAAQARRWRLGLSYAAGVFQANAAFSGSGSTVQTMNSPGVAGPGSFSSLGRVAAAEYQAQERPGRSQQLRLQVSRRLRGRWSLATGVEVAQLESRSATSYLFTGESLADFGGPLAPTPRRATSTRYRTAGLPLELRYANPVKTGFSLYGRVGTVISALLTTRSEVAGNPEATRTYNLFAASTPYRRVLGTGRVGAGVQFRPAGHDYTLSLGPVAEGGLWSLNNEPTEDFFSQNRPYGFGLEASVEFGHSPKAPAPVE